MEKRVEKLAKIARTREAKLRESEGRYRALLDNSMDAIFLTRPDGSIEHANQAACEMFGLSVEEFRRAGRQGIIEPSPELEALLAERRLRGRARGEFMMIRGDGTRFPVEVSSNIFMDAAGGEHTSTIVRDITLRRETQLREAQARSELERANRLKSEFISMVNHEFRTALTGIQGFSELLRDRRLSPEEVHAYAADINLDARRLVRMISEMLDLDRLESGLVKLERRPVDLNQVLYAAVGRAQAASTGHQFGLDLDPALPQVDADPDKLMQVAGNLLGNAVKYSPPGSEVRVSSWRSDDLAEVAVRDHGAGIPAGSLERVFERFLRLDEDVDAIEGTGLGLPIAREIVQLHGGRLWAENAPGGGALLRFELPLAEA